MAADQANIDYTAEITKILRAAKGPMDALDISRALCEANKPLETWDVRGLLIKGKDTIFTIDTPNEIASRITWKIRSTSAELLAREDIIKFHVEGFGLLYLEEKTSDALIEATLAFTASQLELTHPKDGEKQKPRLHVPVSHIGERVAKLATKAGFIILLDL